MKYWDVIMLRKWCESDLQRVVCFKGRCVRIKIMSSSVRLSNDDDWVGFCFDVIFDCVLLLEKCRNELDRSLK